MARRAFAETAVCIIANNIWLNKENSGAVAALSQIFGSTDSNILVMVGKVSAEKWH